MKLRELATFWKTHASNKLTGRVFHIKLPIYDAARIMALTEMYPARTETQLITELLSSALDEFEEALPYVKGSNIIAQDDYNDNIYEDVGLTPLFIDKTKKFLHQLETAPENSTDE